MEADASGEDYREVVAALRREVIPEPASSAASAASGTAGNGVGTSFEALNALATLAQEGDAPAGAGSAAGGADGGGGGAGDAPFAMLGVSEGLGDEAPGFETFNLPELEEWLNVLDTAPAWGFETSPTTGGGLGW